jgi:hypothetical protein
MLVGFLQVIAHGILTNVKLKAPYNPGMGTALLGFLPLGVYYVYLIKGVATTWDWGIGFAYMAGFLFRCPQAELHVAVGTQLALSLCSRRNAAIWIS